MSGLDADGEGRLRGKQATATTGRNMQHCGDMNLTIVGVSPKRGSQLWDRHSEDKTDTSSYHVS